MSRHRYMHNLDDDDYGTYGSYESDGFVSPSPSTDPSLAQYMYSRDTSSRREWEHQQEQDDELMEECIEEIRKTTSAFTRQQMVDALHNNEYDVERALDELFSSTEQGATPANQDVFASQFESTPAAVVSLGPQKKQKQKSRRQKGKKNQSSAKGDDDVFSSDENSSEEEEEEPVSLSLHRQVSGFAMTRGGANTTPFSRGRGRGMMGPNAMRGSPSPASSDVSEPQAATGMMMAAFGRGRGVSPTPSSTTSFTSTTRGSLTARGRGRVSLAAARGRGRGMTKPPISTTVDREEQVSEISSKEGSPTAPLNVPSSTTLSPPNAPSQPQTPPRPTAAADFSLDIVSRFEKEPSPFGRVLIRKPKTNQRHRYFESRFLHKLHRHDQRHFPTLANRLRLLEHATGCDEYGQSIFFKFDKPSPDDLALQARASAGKLQRQPDAKPQNQPVSSAFRKSFKPIIKTAESVTVDRRGAHTVLTIGTSQHSGTTATTTTKPIADIKSPTKTPSSPAVSTPTSPATRERRKKKSDKVVPKTLPPKDEDKERINIVIIGHVDAGKSTLLGHLLVRLGQIDDKLLHKYKKESHEIGKQSFLYAWVLDEQKEERERGVTVNVGVRYFETPQKHVTILDAPGHKDFVPNMITGTAQADVAFLVVDASPGQFERGFQSGGQTKEHLILAKSLGVGEVLVVVNKLDAVDWSMQRYYEVVEGLTHFLKQIGFKESNVTFVPCSGLDGENLVQRSQIPQLTSWYSGPCLLECIDDFKPVKRSVDRALRMVVSDTYRSSHQIGGNVVVAGKLESGHVSVGDRIIIMPIKERCQVRAILRHKSPVSTAYAGDNVEIGLSGIDIQKVSTGQIVCDAEDRIRLVYRFRAQLVTFDPEIPILRGTQCVLHLHHTDIQCTVSKLVSILDKNHEVMKKNPRMLSKNTSAIVEINVDTPVCAEKYSDYKSFGRFMLRQGGATIAAGIITKLKKRKGKKRTVQRKQQLDTSDEVAENMAPAAMPQLLSNQAGDDFDFEEDFM